MSFLERRDSQVPQSQSIIVPPEVDLIREIYKFENQRQRLKAKEYFSATIFPEFLKSFDLKPNTLCNPSVYIDYWPQIGEKSAVSDLLWNMVLLDIIPTENGVIDVYKGKALAIEVNESGELIFHTDKDLNESGLLLPQISWMGDSEIQKEFFDRAFIDSKEVFHVMEFTYPIHD